MRPAWSTEMAKRKCQRFKQTRVGRRCASYGGTQRHSFGQEEDPFQRRAIFDDFRRLYASEDLDSFVHELKSMEAAEINNKGINAQLEYMAEAGGLDWMAELLVGIEGEEFK